MWIARSLVARNIAAVTLYLVQHGEATSEAENPERPLTSKGREDMERVARFLACAGIACSEIRHSGKRRAAETAAILGAALCASTVEPMQGIAPNDDPRPVAQELSAASTPRMLVGHLPFLSRLVGLLVAGDPALEIVRFRTGGVVCLDRQEPHWAVRWMLTPDLLGGPDR